MSPVGQLTAGLLDRICPGRHFANNSLFIIVASVLHVFDIEAPLGEDGQATRVAPNIVLDYFLAYGCLSHRETCADARSV